MCQYATQGIFYLLIVPFDCSQERLHNGEDTNNWESFQQDNKVVPFKLMNAPITFQRMMLSLSGLDAHLQPWSQEDNQEEVFFDASQEFLESPCRTH